MAYEHLDISGDAGVRADGATIEEAFASAALGMYSLITDPGSIREKKRIRVELNSHSMEGLLVGWLNELVFQFDTYGFLGRKVEIDELGDRRLVATVTGEDFDPARHEGRVLIKAATYHGLKMEKTEAGWLLEVMFDI